MKLYVILGLIVTFALAAPLRREYANNLTRSNGVPDRIIWIRICGLIPLDTTQPIAGISCNADMENVAIACRDTHIGYICQANNWITNGK